jgi:hypothetical protein
MVAVRCPTIQAGEGIASRVTNRYPNYTLCIRAEQHPMTKLTSSARSIKAAPPRDREQHKLAPTRWRRARTRHPCPTQALAERSSSLRRSRALWLRSSHWSWHRRSKWQRDRRRPQNMGKIWVEPDRAVEQAQCLVYEPTARLGIFIRPCLSD